MCSELLIQLFLTNLTIRHTQAMRRYRKIFSEEMWHNVSQHLPAQLSIIRETLLQLKARLAAIGFPEAILQLLDINLPESDGDYLNRFKDDIHDRFRENWPDTADIREKFYHILNITDVLSANVTDTMHGQHDLQVPEKASVASALIKLNELRYNLTDSSQEQDGTAYNKPGHVTVDGCIETPYGVQYCSGGPLRSEQQESLPTTTFRSTTQVLGDAAISGACFAAIPEFIGDVLHLSGYLSQASAEHAKLAFSIACVGFSGPAGWIGAASTYVTTKALKSVGCSEQTSRITGNTVGLFARQVVEGVTPTSTSIAASVVSHTAGFFALAAEKQVVKSLFPENNRNVF